MKLFWIVLSAATMFFGYCSAVEGTLLIARTRDQHIWSYDTFFSKEKQAEMEAKVERHRRIEQRRKQNGTPRP